MKKYTLLFVLFVGWMPSFAQRSLEVNETTQGISIFTDKDPDIDKAGGGQAGAIFSCPVTLSLSFSSNIDKQVEVLKTEEQGDLRFYYLRFIVGRYKGANYSNRTLTITASGFLPYRQPLQLEPSASRSFEVFDPNATVGVGCYFEHLNKGNNFFANTRYDDAKTEFMLALECNDKPDENDLTIKIENSGAALDSKLAGDNYYNSGNYTEAKQQYEILYGINPNNYTKERLVACEFQLANLPRTIRVKVIDQNGTAVANVKVEAEIYKVDKQGNLVPAKTGLLTSLNWSQVGTTNQSGECTISVKSINKKLRFNKKTTQKIYFADAIIPTDASNELDVILSEIDNPSSTTQSGQTSTAQNKQTSTTQNKQQNNSNNKTLFPSNTKAAQLERWIRSR